MLLSIYNLLFISMPGGSEWLLIVLAVLILFGGRKIPEFMRGIGRGIREFNDAKNNVKKEIEFQYYQYQAVCFFCPVILFTYQFRNRFVFQSR
jgi:sec-independent protein translocase protein TatA